MRKLLLATTALAGLITVSACIPLSSGTPSQPIINNITPSGGDTGLIVLLTVAGISAFLLLGVLVCVGSYAVYERRRRLDAEAAVEVLTGQPIRQLRMMIRSPVSVEPLLDYQRNNNHRELAPPTT